MTKHFGNRVLLNPSGIQSVGAIVAEVEDTSGWKPGRDRYGKKLKKWNATPLSTLAISDCSRSVALSIQWDTKEEREAALVKVDRMIDALTDFRVGLVEEQQRYEKRLKELKKK